MEKIKIPNIPLGPFPVVIVGAMVDGKPNYVTAGACGVVCQKPVLYASIKDTHYTTPGIQESGFFSVNIPSAELVRQTDYCGLVSGKTEDKSKVFTPFYDDEGTAPLIRECPVNILCKVFQTIPVFGFQMFLGEIRSIYLNDDCLTDGKPDPLKINPILLMGTGYWQLDQQIGSIFQEGRELSL